MGEHARKFSGKSRTVQSFKDQCDINKILHKAARTGTLTHLAKHEPQYGDFVGFDYTESVERIAAAKSMFMELPAEVRNEFDQDPGKFLDFVNKPENVDNLAEKLPALAKPGRQLPKVIGNPAPAESLPAEPASVASTDAAGVEAPEAPSSPA